MVDGAKAVSVERDGTRVTAVTMHTSAGLRTVACRRLVVADGVRSPLGKILGRTWHRGHRLRRRGPRLRRLTAQQRPVDHLTPRTARPHRSPAARIRLGLPARDRRGQHRCRNPRTSARPASGSLRPLIDLYAAQRRPEWGLGEVTRVASALLPMGGAVSGIAGRNWALIGDAAACVNPLNGEGIDYGLEGGRLVAPVLDSDDLTHLWPTLLRERYGRAFSAARRPAGLLTVPQFLPATGPIAMRSRALMTVAVRIMGNLVTDADADLVARAWRTGGRTPMHWDRRPLFT